MVQLVDFKEKAYVTKINELPVTKNDTLFLEMSKNANYAKLTYRDIFKSDEFKVYRDDNQNLDLVIKTFLFMKNLCAKKKNIQYGYTFDKNTLMLNSYFTTDISHKFRDQGVEVIVTLPKEAVLYANKNTYTFNLANLLKNGVIKSLRMFNLNYVVV